MFPATGYLFLAWDTLAMTKGYQHFDISVEFEDIKFLRATTISNDTEVEFTIVIQPGSGRFEISEKTSTLVTGVIRTVEKPRLRKIINEETDKSLLLPNRDFYKELRLRGYHYNGLFRSVTEGSSDGRYGKVKWDSNWVAFLDCLLQVQIIGQDTRSLMLPTSIQRLAIDTPLQQSMIKDLDENDPHFDVHYSSKLKNIRSGGIEIVNLIASAVGRRRPQGDPVLESYKFIPYDVTLETNSEDAIRIFIQITLENAPVTKVKAVEVDTINTKKTILPEIRSVLEDLPLVTSELIFLSTKTLEDTQIQTENLKLSTQSDCYMIISTNCLENFGFLEKSSSSFSDHGFFVCRENFNIDPHKVALPEGFNLISSIRTEDELLCVLQLSKKPNNLKATSVKISEQHSNYDWIDDVQKAMKNGPIVLVAENEPCSGLIGLVNCLRKEPNGSNVRCVFIDDLAAPKFSLDDPFYSNQLKAEMAINILKNGNWGSYRHLQVRQSFTERPALDHCYVNALVKSDLSSLKWISGPFNYARPKGELVKVQYSALNFKDVMLATGKVSAEMFSETRLDLECILGLEYSGVTESGRRVMGMVQANALVSSLK